FFSSRRRHTRFSRDWSSDVCSSDLTGGTNADQTSAGQMHADTAATGMALLCFLGAGYTHTDGKYRDAVGAGLAHLVGHQKDNGRSEERRVGEEGRTRWVRNLCSKES